MSPSVWVFFLFVFFRVVTLESTRENGVAADICWTRETDGDVLESTFQRVYVCGSLDFLISVSHFFLDDPAADVSSVESLKESEPEKQHRIVQGNLKAEGKFFTYTKTNCHWVKCFSI